MKGLGLVMAVATALIIAPAAGFAEPKASTESKGRSEASKKVRAPYERAWAAAVRAIDKPGACNKVIGEENADLLGHLCLLMSTSYHPHCRSDYSCKELSGNVWGWCTLHGWDPKMNRQTPRDPNHVPCLDFLKPWE